MSIIKNLEIKINNDTASLSEDIYVYQKDRGIDLKLKINQIRTNQRSTIRSSIFDSENIYASATIMKPNGELIGKRKSAVEDNIITFTIDKEFTDQMDEIGTYKVQFHLYDGEDSRITIPPIKFEVKELIGEVDDNILDYGYGAADNSGADLCVVVDDEDDLIIFSNGKYIKTVWNKGDLITSSKLNKIEEAIETLDERFHIGGKPLYKDATIWIDVPDLDISNILLNEANLTSDDSTEPFNDSCENSLFDMLKSINKKIEMLEKEIELLKK